jgi:POTRA domain-containing FtsQ-type protein
MTAPAGRARGSRSRTPRSAAAPGWRFGPSPARAAALLAIVACLLALYGLQTTPALAIQRIEVSPLSWTDHDTLVRWLGVEPGVNAVQLATDHLAARAEELPSVATAHVEVRLPETLAVTIVERAPILVWRVGDAAFLADRDGMLFALAPKAGAGGPALPTIVDGRAASRVILGIGTRIDPTDLDAATRLASLTPDDVGSRADRLTVRITDADGFVVTTTPASWTAVFGPYSPILRTPELIPGQVRLLRSMLFGNDDRLARITLADDRNGTYVPAPTSR